MASLLRKYGVQTDIYLPLIKAGSQDFAKSADYTPAAGDVTISKDGAAAANTTNLPTAITMGNTAMWKLTLTAAEMSAAKIMICISDAAPKAVEDQMILIETYGNVSAEHEFDLDSSAVTVGTNNDKTGYSLTAAYDPAKTAAQDTDIQTLLIRVPAEVAQKQHLVNGTGNITPPVNTGLWDRLDAAVSSRANASDYTASRAAKLDNLDATITSRQPSGDVTVGDYTIGKSPAEQILSTPANKLATDATGKVSLTSASIQAIWDVLTSSLTTVGSIGKKLADWVLGSDNKVVLSNNAHTGAVIPTVTSVTNDVGITQAGADKVWVSTTRTLTSLGASLVQEIWDKATSALITVGSIGKFLVDRIDATISSRQPSGNVTVGDYAVGKSPAEQILSTPANKLSTNATGAVTVGVNNDKTGYSLLADQSNVTIGTVNALGAQARAAVNDEVDAALDTAIPVNPTANSINERVKAIDVLTEAGGLGDLAAIKLQTDKYPPGFKKNTAFNNFYFKMVDSSDHVTGKTGLVVTATRSLDGGVFSLCVNTPVEVGYGWYKIDLAASDLNGDSGVLRFTAAGADATEIFFTTEP